MKADTEDSQEQEMDPSVESERRRFLAGWNYARDLEDAAPPRLTRLPCCCGMGGGSRTHLGHHRGGDTLHRAYYREEAGDRTRHFQIRRRHGPGESQAAAGTRSAHPVSEREDRTH